MPVDLHHIRILKYLHDHLGAVVVDPDAPIPPPQPPSVTTTTPTPTPAATYRKRKNKPDANHLTFPTVGGSVSAEKGHRL